MYYVYIYIERERLCVYIYIYTYILHVETLMLDKCANPLPWDPLSSP